MPILKNYRYIMEGYTCVPEDDNYDDYFLWNLPDHGDVIDDDGEDWPTQLQKVFENLPLGVEEFTEKGALSHPKEPYQTRSPTSVLHDSADLEVKSTATSPELLVSDQTQTRRKHRTKTQTKHPRPASIWHLIAPTMPHNTKKHSAKKKKNKDLIKISDKTEDKDLCPNQPVSVKKCSHCQVTKTPQWRVGPEGPSTLCNACGVRYRTSRLHPEYRPAASPTFVPLLHSNFHRRVMKMRNKSIQEPCVNEMNLATFLTPTELHDPQVGSDIFKEVLVPENHHPLAMLQPPVLPVGSYLSDLWNQG